MIDLHNHLVPGVDDGATNLGQSLEALAAMAQQGVRRLVATPHLRGSETTRGKRLEQRLEQLDRGWAQLQQAVRTIPADLQIARGAELLLDVPAPDLSDPRTRLAGTRFVLVEFGGAQIPPRSREAFEGLRRRGWIPVLAHPERYQDFHPQDTILSAWREAGAVLQVNAGSLLGQYGAQVQKSAWALLHGGHAALVASDYHARGRLALRAAQQRIREQGGGEQAELLFATNPGRILDEQNPEPVPSLAPSTPNSFWQRLRFWAS